MNREVLFRGKRVDNGEWVEGYLVEDDHNSYRTFIVISAHWEIDEDGNTDLIETEVVEVIPETVGQYTGLTDKNGVKIFEGDIVKHGSLIVEVTYIQKYTRFAGKRKGCVMAVFDWNSCEVIGNIYDNPELLEDGDTNGK